MAFSRHLGVIGILCGSWLVAVGCNDDEDRNGDEAGEGGEATDGGKSTSGGSANDAGKSGNVAAGEGGMATGGTTTAGSGGTGTSGSAGSATTGGAGAGAGGGDDAGGAGGASAGSGGASAGAGGDGGAGGTPAATLKSCGNGCEIDDDCKVVSAVTQKKCDQVSHRCYDPTPAECETNAQCIPGFSLWFANCANDAECATGEACVGISDLGYCAALPVDGCEFGLEPTTLARFGAAGDVTVCANTYTRCRAGVCDPTNCADPIFGLPCEGVGGGDSCNADTGLCECTLGTECESGVCGSNKQCAQCAVDEDCLGNPLSGWDTCVNGSCGCSSASVCPDLTQAGVPVCE